MPSIKEVLTIAVVALAVIYINDKFDLTSKLP
jgi:hypothetical protein